MVVNYDAFRLDPDVADAYADMVRSLEDAFYTRVSRYTTSAFMRVKLGAGPDPHRPPAHLREQV